MGLVPPNSVRRLNAQLHRGTDVVYLARRLGTTRSVRNEDDVLKMIRSKLPNVRVVFPQNNWRRDREAVKNANVIIGPHGGALSLMIFAPPGTIILEFTPLVQFKRDGKNERPCYFGLAHGLGFKYHAVEPSVFHFDRGTMVVPTKRVATALNEFAPLGKKWTILITVNSGYFDFFENWWLHFVQLNITNRVVVIAEDARVLKALEVCFPSIDVERSLLDDVDVLSYNTGKYLKMVSSRALYIGKHLRRGEDILYTDVDTVWLADPIPHIQQDVDITAQLDDRNYYCTGFMAIRSTARALSFIERWNKELTRKAQLNQPVFNRLLTSSSGVQHASLPSDLFPSGRQYFDEFSIGARKEAVVVHNNFVIGHDNKRERFEIAGLWLVQGSKQCRAMGQETQGTFA
jgi:rhamnogalacturonan II specific xylosyltransferase